DVRVLTGVEDGLVQIRVERLADGAERLEVELAQRRAQLIGHGLEAAGQLAVLLGTTEVVEHGQQLGQHLLLAGLDRADAIVLDAALVVDELCLLALEVGGALGQLLLERGALGGGRLDRLLRRVRGTADGRLPLGGGRLVERLLGPFCSPSSSTISASTTSSSAGASPAGAPSAPASAAAAAYMASPIFELEVPSFVTASWIAVVSSPSRADFSASMSAWTSVLTSSPTLSPFSARNFSVEWTSVSDWMLTSTASRRLRERHGIVV